MKFKPVDKIMS